MQVAVSEPPFDLRTCSTEQLQAHLQHVQNVLSARTAVDDANSAAAMSEQALQSARQEVQACQQQSEWAETRMTALLAHAEAVNAAGQAHANAQSYCQWSANLQAPPRLDALGLDFCARARDFVTGLEQEVEQVGLEQVK